MLEVRTINSSCFNFHAGKKVDQTVSLQKIKSSYSDILVTATLLKRETALGTSPRVVRLILTRAGSISSLHGGKPNLEENDISACNLEANIPCNKRPTVILCSCSNIWSHILGLAPLILLRGKRPRHVLFLLQFSIRSEPFGTFHRP